MTNDDGGPQPPLTTTYAVPREFDEPSPAPGTGPSRNKMIAIGVGGAVALGVLLGVVMGPSFKDPGAEMAMADQPTTAGRVKIQVTTRQAPAPKVAMNAGKIDAAGTVIQPTPATAPAYAPPPAEPRKEHRGLLGALAGIFGVGGNDEPRERLRPAPAPRPAAPEPRNEQVVVLDRPQPQPQPRAQVEVTDTRDVEPAAYEDAPYPPRREYVARPSFNCRYARSRAEQMVCEDPRLAAYDRRLARAFRRAVDNGASYGRLRAQQDRWLAARERAAVSPAAVGMVYQQRIDELEQMGQPPEDDGDGGGEGW
jgi:hypothetical protein